jgi:hypothetical protein
LDSDTKYNFLNIELKVVKLLKERDELKKRYLEALKHTQELEQNIEIHNIVQYCTAFHKTANIYKTLDKVTKFYNIPQNSAKLYKILHKHT